METWTGQPWAAPYRQAILETRRPRLPKRIDTARAAINARILQLKRSPGWKQELESLQDALKILRFLEGNLRAQGH